MRPATSAATSGWRRATPEQLTHLAEPQHRCSQSPHGSTKSALPKLTVPNALEEWRVDDHHLQEE